MSTSPASDSLASAASRRSHRGPCPTPRTFVTPSSPLHGGSHDRSHGCMNLLDARKPLPFSCFIKLSVFSAARCLARTATRSSIVQQIPILEKLCKFCMSINSEMNRSRESHSWAPRGGETAYNMRACHLSHQSHQAMTANLDY